MALNERACRGKRGGEGLADLDEGDWQCTCPLTQETIESHYLPRWEKKNPEENDITNWKCPTCKHDFAAHATGTIAAPATAPANDVLQPLLENIALELKETRNQIQQSQRDIQDGYTKSQTDIRDGYENLTILLSNLKLATQKRAPSRMSDLTFKSLRGDVVSESYQTPDVEEGSKQRVAEIVKKLDAARLVPPKGNELQDRTAVIDGFLNDVAEMYNFHAWSNDCDANVLILNDVDPDKPGDCMTRGYVDLSVSPVEKTRPRFLGFQVNKKRGNNGKDGEFKPYRISQKNRDQTMGYLEALRRHLPDRIYPCGLVTTLEWFYFYRCTGSYEFLESNAIHESQIVALFLNDIFTRAKIANGEIPATSNSRNVLDEKDPRPNSNGGSRDAGAGEDPDTLGASDAANGRESPGGDLGGKSSYWSGSSKMKKKGSASTLLTKAALADHDSWLVRRALKLN